MAPPITITIMSPTPVEECVPEFAIMALRRDEKSGQLYTDARLPQVLV